MWLIVIWKCVTVLVTFGLCRSNVGIGERQYNIESRIVICIATFQNCNHMFDHSILPVICGMWTAKKQPLEGEEEKRQTQQQTGQFYLQERQKQPQRWIYFVGPKSSVLFWFSKGTELCKVIFARLYLPVKEVRSALFTENKNLAAWVARHFHCLDGKRKLL